MTDRSQPSAKEDSGGGQQRPFASPVTRKNVNRRSVGIAPPLGETRNGQPPATAQYGWRERPKPIGRGARARSRAPGHARHKSIRADDSASHVERVALFTRGDDGETRAATHRQKVKMRRETRDQAQQAESHSTRQPSRFVVAVSLLILHAIRRATQQYDVAQQYPDKKPEMPSVASD
jgi:hypothetical protein